MGKRTAVLGGGVMGSTLMRSVIAAGHPDVVVIEKNSERVKELVRDYRVTAGPDLELIDGADVLILAVKPQDVPALLPQLADRVSDATIVVSLAAGVKTTTLEAGLGHQIPVVRVMPNTPAVVGEGMFGVSPGVHVSAEQLESVEELLAAGGKSIVIPEDQQDALTSVSGSGPAYVFYLAESMIAAGVAEGLDPDVARQLTNQTLVGAAKLLAESTETPAELRRQVTSPKGATYEATTTFDESGVAAGLVKGIRAAAKRSAELG
ncbi:MAG: pyrroline-5-carboxylate reductase [Aeromicrobium sp.]|nr:MAG: pyrroline-5-carboxylate reductase [Aeromicrobium sp.]